MTTLIIAPHPDDEVIGCGGTIAKRVKEGNNVFVIIVCSPQEPDYTRWFILKELKESKTANNILGVTKMVNLNTKSTKLDVYTKKALNDTLTELVDKLNPDEVFIPHKGDIHHDHQIVAEAALVAVRPKAGKKPRKVYAYEVMSETDWNAPYVGDIFIPNMYVDISETIDTKLDAMEAYESQLMDYPAARSLKALKALAMHRGTTVGVKYAEAFSLIREVQA